MAEGIFFCQRVQHRAERGQGVYVQVSVQVQGGANGLLLHRRGIRAPGFIPSGLNCGLHAVYLGAALQKHLLRESPVLSTGGKAQGSP